MTDDTPGRDHFSRLEHLYHAAPVTRSHGTRLRVGEGESDVSLVIREEHLHAAGAVHGSLYFRVLDDAAFFAANSLVDDVLLLTASFSVELLRPAEAGVITAHGEVIERMEKRFLCSAEARDDQGDLIAWGSGTFIRSRIPLDAEVGYR